MSQTTERTLSHYALIAFTDEYFSLASHQRISIHTSILEGLRAIARKVDVYQVFPTEHGSDVCIWTAIDVPDDDATHRFFAGYAKVFGPHRRYMRFTSTLWGFTRPSQYSRAQRSTQEIDPFAETRKPYLVIYPFVKSAEWYMSPPEERQRMMNEHIRVGKQYPDITQLLLYSFGLQDQEFVVVYEMEELPLFSQLVADLRATEGRAYTVRDTPLHTCLWHEAETTLGLF